MCGIAGFIRPGGFAEDWARSVATDMAGALAARGPDDAGEWIDHGAGVALAHRRLSIVDLSPAGHQPMLSSSGRYVMIINGEIYNHQEMRRELEGHDWNGHSDTEVLLAAIERWGLESAVKRSVGMFAIALWDRQTQQLYLTRDRIGEKPLCYGWQGRTFMFGSDTSALQNHPDFLGEICNDSLPAYLRMGYVAAPHTMYEGIHKLMPGCIMKISFSEKGNGACETNAYWSLSGAVDAGRSSPFGGTPDEACDELESYLRNAIRLQMLADVPVGAFLSGGIDSSTVVALMQQEHAQPVRTFTIGFEEQEYDEAPYARAIARHLGTDHNEICVSSRDALDVIPKLGGIYDEPFGDSSSIPTYLVAALARQQVTVCLSGDGGDELFCGYRRYQRTVDHWNLVRRIPLFARRGVNAAFTALPYRNRHLFRESLCVKSDLEFYRSRFSQWKKPHRLLQNTQSTDSLCPERQNPNIHAAHLERLMFDDTLVYLPDDILAKLDRAAMASSLETRVPMLDHQVIEFAWSLPLEWKLQNGKSKWILRNVLRKHIPDRLVERPKKGFGVPLDSWLRGPLREWAEDLLQKSRLEQEGVFNSNQINLAWKKHMAGQNGLGEPLWVILMFQDWLRRQKQSRH